jgi:predicted MFS family arabinose efflux permease
LLDRVFNRLSLAGMCATLIGNGIGRFAFIALMPALVAAGWFSKSEASYLGVATLVGYVVGAPLTDWLGRRLSSAVLLRGAMLVCSASFFACALQGAGMPWYCFWRTVAGVSGAVLMVLPAAVVLPAHSPRVRGRASGVVFSGVGLGAVVAGALVPLLISGVALSAFFGLDGVAGAWIGMGGVCLLATFLAWKPWPSERRAEASDAVSVAEPLSPAVRRTVGLLLLAYGLNAVGYLAHTLFWVDYLVRELGLSLATGGAYWAMFGLGAAIGPLLTGALADSLGLKRCLLAGFVLKACAAILPVLSSGPLALFASSLLMGIFTPGIASLVSAYALDRVSASHHRKTWGLLTSGFALAQAGGGALMAFAAARLDSYQPLFCVSAVALVGSVACIAVSGAAAQRDPVRDVGPSDDAVATPAD